jgi:vanillate O-demethylase monooxygenase subunit
MGRTRGYHGQCDRWQIARFLAPSNVAIDVGVAETGSGAPAGDRSRGINAYILNSLTPATPTSCWYFWANARNFCLEDAALTREMTHNINRIFNEDKVIVQAQQRAMSENPGKRMISINLDAGANRVRRMIETRSQITPQPTAA